MAEEQKCEDIFSPHDIEILRKNNKTVDAAKKECELLLRGVQYAKTYAAATIENNGIKIFDKKHFDELVNIGKLIISQDRFLHFNPAAGAASRMFAALEFFYNNKGKYTLQQIHEINKEYYHIIKEFIERLHDFAFYDDLTSVMEKNKANIADPYEAIKYLLHKEGLNYINIPKAFLKAHRYSKSKIIDAFEEQIVEGLSMNVTKYHFTFSPEHEYIAKRRIGEVIKKYPDKKIEITYSFQELCTNTISLDMETKTPFRKQNGDLLLRSGGHGTVIGNVNRLKKEMIFLKNIENVSKESMQHIFTSYLKMNIGYLWVLKNKIFDMIPHVLNKEIPISEVVSFMEKELCLVVPDSFYELSLDEQYKIIFDKLNRPIKICQEVPNRGEPGGGPTWVIGKDGFRYLRIVEQSESEGGKNNPHMKNGTHFNPACILVYTKDYKGNFFDLEKYVNWDACFISEKFSEGKAIRALELPGLWNGSMEDHITLFVECPIDSFQPVKFVNDWLRDAHQAQKN
jgi:hypothetical protein